MTGIESGGGKLPGPSVLKKTSAFAQQHGGHRRVFSHGQIKFNTDGVAAAVASSTGSTAETTSTAAAAAAAQTDHDIMIGPTAAAADGLVTASSAKGHRRQGSKTEFILPPGHEERKRNRTAALARYTHTAVGCFLHFTAKS